MTLKTSIFATYKSVDGWHVFQSEDMPGLYVASRDAERAYNDVGPAIETLLDLDEGIRCKVVPEVSFKEFVRAVKTADDGDDAYDVSSLVLSDRRFCLVGATA